MSSNFLNSYHLETSEDVISKMVTSDTNGRIIDNEHIVGDRAPISGTYIAQASQTPIVKGSDVTVKGAMLFDKNTMDILTTGSMLADPETALTNRFNNFSRYGHIDPVHEMITGAREYIFFSKPDLHLMDRDGYAVILNRELEGDPFFKEAFKHYRYSFYSLQQYYGLLSDPFKGDFNSRNKYIPLLSNMVSSSFDLSDISANEVQGNQNLYQVNTSYREGSITADLQYDFSLEFKDTKYLDVYMLFKIYDEYFRAKYESGVTLTPNRDEYSEYRIFPEAFSVWKVITDDTNRIVFWAKATGVTAMSVPRGSISNLDGTIKFTINFKAQFIKDMDPVHLMELNNLTNMSLVSFKSNSYEYVPDVTKENWVGYPVIRMQSKSGMIGSNKQSFVRTGDVENQEKSRSLYRLMWIKPTNTKEGRV